MKILRTICERVSNRLPLRRIGVEGEDYLRRYYVCGRLPVQCWPGVKPRLAWLPFTVYLHCFLKPDQTRDLHNHPWSWALSFILAGGYIEERLGRPWAPVDDAHPLDRYGIIEIKRCEAPALNVIRHDTCHRVSDLLYRDDAGCLRLRLGGGPAVWTLFVTGRKVGTWGFWNKRTGRWCPHREYTAHLGRQPTPSRAVPNNPDRSI